MATQTSTSSSSSFGTSMLLRLQGNDSVAWKELVELYAPLIFHWCKTCRLESADSADIMQEVFVAASRGITSFKTTPGGNLQGWLWTITQNKIRDFVRKQDGKAHGVGGTQAQIQLAEIAMELHDDEPTTFVESHQLLHRALEQIKTEFAAHTWTAFWRSAVESHATHWIAEDLGISPNSVRQAKSRVLRRLRQQLGEV